MPYDVHKTFDENYPKVSRFIVGIPVFLIAVVLVVVLAGCGSKQTLQQACADHGGKDPSAKIYRDDDGQETRCMDGSEVENEGGLSGWQVDD